VYTHEYARWYSKFIGARIFVSFNTREVDAFRSLSPRTAATSVFIANDTSAVYDLLFPLLTISPVNLRRSGEKTENLACWRLCDRSARCSLRAKMIIGRTNGKSIPIIRDLQLLWMLPFHVVTLKNDRYPLERSDHGIFRAYSKKDSCY